jgi:hypothetical protein
MVTALLATKQRQIREKLESNREVQKTSAQMALGMIP